MKITLVRYVSAKFCWHANRISSGCHNAYDYYGESDAETCLNDESLDAPDSGESQSSVIMSEVCV